MVELQWQRVDVCLHTQIAAGPTGVAGAWSRHGAFVLTLAVRDAAIPALPLAGLPFELCR
jgi:hypothetical protein